MEERKKAQTHTQPSSITHSGLRAGAASGEDADVEQPAPRIMIAPEAKRREVPMTVIGLVIGVAMGAARRVEKRHGKKR